MAMVNGAANAWTRGGRLWSGLSALVAVLAGTGVVAAPLSKSAEAEGPVDFNTQIRPLISANCFPCHGPDESSRKAKMRLDLREEAIKERKGRFPIKPGEPDHSELIARITATDPDEVMPPPKTGHRLTVTEKVLLRRWIAQGAPYAVHWAFKKPDRPTLPSVRHKEWPKNPIDQFILARLEAAGLEPSPPADWPALSRRLHLDLIGLPPTPEETESFVQAVTRNPQSAVAALVDRLLALPSYGERWARPWLDLARYADSAGYGSDPLRLNIWPWRDWVIAALNRNLPFDRFTLEQLAGDLLPDPTEEQRVATAFHRNTMTNTEGGTDDEEWRIAAVKDRVNVTVQAWMGLTVGCAQCHTHKFDPISQREYYQLAAFFNQTEDNDQPDERPTLPLPTKEQREQMLRLTNQITTLEKELRAPSAEVLAELTGWEKARAGASEWTVIEPLEFKSAKGASLSKLADGSLLASGESPDKDTYTLQFRVALSHLTGVRLEVLPDDSLPGTGPGRSSHGNFVLSDFRLEHKPAQASPKQARFVRVENPGKGRILSLAEVEVFSRGTNVARAGQASQSSTDFEGAAERAIDGHTDGHYFNAKSTSHTRTEDNPWWELDLGAERSIETIIIWNRTDGDNGKRLSNFRVAALDTNRKIVWETQVAGPPKPSARLALDGARRIELRHASADFSQKDFDVAQAIDAAHEGKAGWAVGTQLGRPHVAVFETVAELGPGLLTVTLGQQFGERHTLGRFRIAATGLPRPVRVVPPRIASILATVASERTETQQRELEAWFAPMASCKAKVSDELAQRKKELAEIKPVALPIMRELPPAKRRTTHLLSKGNFLDPGEVVSPAVLAALHPWPEGAPTNRLGLAQWLVSPDNPLTARVLVNRLWAQLFGTGLVETEEDFGTQGMLPSHPELLDWLAVEFVRPVSLVETVKRSTVESADASTLQRFNASTSRPWDVKRLLKLIVTSAAYQQSSRTTPELLEKDPRNRLLSRYPRRRLDAEMVRDQALALSGLLSRKIGGPSVYPPQPEGLWRAAFNTERTYTTSPGENRYRRGLYTIWRRTVPYPSMATFDAPSRETCTFRRLPTNTPLQAYVTLNDPVFVECAQALGRRLAREGGATVADRVRFGLRLVLARPPEDKQVETLARLYESEVGHYREHEDDALRLATKPLGPLPSGLTPAEAAAWTVVANVLLNLDGVLTKG